MKLVTKPSHVFAVITGLVVAIYSHAFQCDFINFDDNTHIFQNPVVTHGLSWPAIQYAFTHFIAGQWIPLTWVSHMLDVSLFGLNPSWPHLENVLLHAVNACLVWVVFKRLTQRPGLTFVVALLFAIHPINVESVAWVAERKNLLSTLFWLLAMDAYARYAQRPEQGFRLWIVGLWMALGLLAKQMLVTLPCALLLLDVWPLRRAESISWRRLISEKWMLFALSIASSYWTIHGASGSGYLMDSGAMPVYARIETALVGYAGYLVNLVLPVSLGILYPLRRYPLWQIGSAAVLLLGISVAVWRVRKTKPYWIIGWFWFLGILVPVSGIFQIGPQAYADRFAYLPELGLFWAVVWAASEIKWVSQKHLVAVVSVLTVFLAGLTWRQVGFWTDTASIFEHTLTVAADTGMTSGVAGDGRELRGDYPEAIAHFREAVRVRPKSAINHFRLGKVLIHEKQMVEGIQELKISLSLDPGCEEARRLLVKVLAATGQETEARAWLPSSTSITR